VLKAAGIKTVGEVHKTSDKTLLGLQDLGQSSVTHLRETLGRDGVKPLGKGRLKIGQRRQAVAAPVRVCRLGWRGEGAARHDGDDAHGYTACHSVVPQGLAFRFYPDRTRASGHPAPPQPSNRRAPQNDETGEAFHVQQAAQIRAYRTAWKEAGCE
jgi:hypothetical protein